MATEMVPGPVVSGMVSGKNASSLVPRAVDACSCLRPSFCSGADSISQALTATTSPPATLSALKETPKKPMSVAPTHREASMTPSE